MKILSALLALALPAAALAQDAAFDPKGAWLFRTDEVQNGRPVCTETWTFGEDGRMSVESGAERVEKRYRIEEDRDGTWIVSEALSTNHQPDCMGYVTAAIEPGENRTLILRFNNGTVLTCPPPGHTADGIPIIGSCYGRIIPMDQVG
ncbi:MAG: hypothetical protein V4707_07015 [Pseudomonadota bacterium]